MLPLAALLLVPCVLSVPPSLDGSWHVQAIYRDGTVERKPGDSRLIVSGSWYNFIRNGNVEAAGRTFAVAGLPGPCYSFPCPLISALDAGFPHQVLFPTSYTSRFCDVAVSA